MNIISFLIILPLVIWGIGVIAIVINSLKGIIKSKAYEAHKVAMLKLTIGLVMLVLLAYYLFSFYCYTFYSAFFQSYHINNLIFNHPGISPIEVFSKALETGYVPYILVLIMILGFNIHFYKIQKSWHKYFRIVVVLGLVFLYNSYLAYQIGSRLHEVHIEFGMVESDSTYGLADMFSDINVWAIVICGLVMFLVWSIVLDLTISTYKYISCKQGKQVQPQQPTEVDTVEIVELIKLLSNKKYANIDPKIMLAHNKALEKSPDYQKILPEVMTEVYTKYVVYKIAKLEESLKRAIDENRTCIDEIQIKITQAKQLMAENKIEEAFELVRQRLGACHTLWPLKQHILYDKYGIIWYTPIECCPDTYLD